MVRAGSGFCVSAWLDLIGSGLVVGSGLVCFFLFALEVVWSVWFGLVWSLVGGWVALFV